MNIKKVKSRKDYICSKCGKTIQKGEEYIRGNRFRLSPVIRCVSCNVKGYEVSSSEFVQSVGAIVEDWERETGWNHETSAIGDFESMKEEIISSLENIRDEQEDKLGNLPEQFQDSKLGELISGRIEMLEEAICSLQAIDPDPYAEFSSEDEENSQVQFLLELTNEVQTALDAIQY